jgi:hypothetical protein
MFPGQRFMAHPPRTTFHSQHRSRDHDRQSTGRRDRNESRPRESRRSGKREKASSSASQSEKGRGKTSGSSSAYQQATRSVDSEVIAARRKNGDCLKCGKSGHSWNDCWGKEPNGSAGTDKRKGDSDSRGSSSFKRPKPARLPQPLPRNPVESSRSRRTRPRTWISIFGVKCGCLGKLLGVAFGLPTGGKGHGGDAEDFLCYCGALKRGVVKRAKTTSGVLASPRKGRAVRDGLNAVDPRVPSARVYGAYVNPDAADLLRQAPNEGEYYVGLEYFWAQLFMQSRNYNAEERASHRIYHTTSHSRPSMPRSAAARAQRCVRKRPGLRLSLPFSLPWPPPVKRSTLSKNSSMDPFWRRRFHSSTAEKRSTRPPKESPEVEKKKNAEHLSYAR